MTKGAWPPWPRKISAPMVGSAPIGRVSPQMSLHPSPIANAAVKERSPSEEMAVFSTPSWELDMSTYGATCPTEAKAGVAETTAPSARPEATSSAEDPAAASRGLPRRSKLSYLTLRSSFQESF